MTAPTADRITAGGQGHATMCAALGAQYKASCQDWKNLVARPAEAGDRWCPECGAELRPEATICWLCGRRLPRPRKSRASAAPDERRRGGAVVGLVLSILLLAIALPFAGAVALFCMCVGPTVARGSGPPGALATVSLLVVGTFVVLTSLVMIIVSFGSKLRP